MTEFTRLVWENGRQLVELEMVPAANREYTVNYSYDADGIRSQKVVTATLGTGGTVQHDYVTQGGKVIRETTTHGSSVQVLDFIYDTAGQPYALVYKASATATPETYYYVLNLQGDVVELIDDAGTTVAEYSYNAWGEIITATGSMAEINPLRYRSYYYDAETGFYYLQSRYYDPVIKRFINADSYQSTGQGFVGTNMFAYCNNNPVNCVDTAGTYADAVAVGTIAGTGGAGVVIAIIVIAYFVISDSSTTGWIKATTDYMEPEFEPVEPDIEVVDAPVGQGAISYASKIDAHANAKAVVLSAAKRESNAERYYYWSAELINGVVTPFAPLKYGEAKQWVSMGGSLLCANQGAAFAIARFYPKNKHEGPHRQNDPTYLPHYHITHGNHDVHIWYYK